MNLVPHTTPSEPTRIEKITMSVGSVPSLVLHTAFFIAAFVIGFLGLASWSMVLLVLTTAVSLEAIYLAIFIQMTVNKHTQSLREVQEDIDEIEDDIEEMHEDDLRDSQHHEHQQISLRQLHHDMQEILTKLQNLESK